MKFPGFFALRSALALLPAALAACAAPPQAPQPAVPLPTPTPLQLEVPHLAWSRPLGAPINHPPLRVGDVVIAAPVGEPLAGLDAASGDLLWEFDPGVRIWDRAYASDGERLFLGIEGGLLLALDPSRGEVLWQLDVGLNTQIPPLLADGVLYVSTTFVGPGLVGDPDGRARLLAVDATSGDVLWDFESDNYILQSPFAHGDSVYVAGSFSSDIEVDEGGHMRLYALDAASGSVRWTYESTDGYPKQLYATDRAVAYIAYQDFTTGVDPSSGERIWRQDTGNWVPTFSGYGDVIYYGSANTIVHAIDANSGDVLWQFNIPTGTFNYIIGAPMRDGGELVFLTQQGDLIGLDAATGEMLWSLSTGIAGARAGIRVAGHWIYIGDAQGVVYGFTDR